MPPLCSENLQPPSNNNPNPNPKICSSIIVNPDMTPIKANDFISFK